MTHAAAPWHNRFCYLGRGWALTVVGCAFAFAAMAPTVVRGKKASGRRVTNKSLQLRRTPHAFALFLKHMTGKRAWYKGRRLRAKTMIWRMDLLSLRFRMLPAVERDAFRTQSAAALAQKKTERAAILHNLRSAPSESGKASANAYAAHLSDRVQACAWHKG